MIDKLAYKMARDAKKLIEQLITTEEVLLPIELPFNIFKTAGQYYTDFKIEDYKVPVKKRYYVDNINGASSGDGTISSPYNSIHQAITQTDCDEVVIKEGVYGWSTGNAGHKPLRDINIIADGNVVIGSFRENVRYTQDPTHTNVFHAPMRNIAYVVDLTDIDRPVMYKKVNSIEECNDATRSYYLISNTDVYVNTGNGEPDENVYLMLANPALASDDVNVYVEGITFLNTVFHNSTAEPRKTLYANKCNFYFSSAGNCVSTTGSDSILVKCSAQYSDRDGFNYHERNGIKPLAIELDCTARYNGLDGADQSNGSTMHDGGTVVRVGGVYEENHGPNVIDVNEGGKSYNVGVKASRSTATAGTVSNSDFKNGNIGKSDMLLIDCTSFGSDYSVVTAGGGETIIEGGLILGEIIEMQ